MTPVLKNLEALLRGYLLFRVEWTENAGEPTLCYHRRYADALAMRDHLKAEDVRFIGVYGWNLWLVPVDAYRRRSHPWGWRGFSTIIRNPGFVRVR